MSSSDGDVGGLRGSLDATRQTLEGTNGRLDRLDRQSRRQRVLIVLLAVLIALVVVVWRHDTVQRCNSGNNLREATVTEVESAMRLLGETLEAEPQQVTDFLVELERRRPAPLHPRRCSYIPDF